MNIAIDIILLAVLAICAIAGFRKGAIATLISLLGGLAATVGALLIASPLSGLVAQSIILPAISGPVTATIENCIRDTGLSQLAQGASETFNSLLATFGVSLDALNLPTGADASVDAQDIAIRLLTPIANGLAFAITFLVLFVVFTILVRLLIRATKRLNNLPVLGRFNQLLGLIIGLVQGLLVAWVISALFTYFLPSLQTMDGSPLAAFTAESTTLYRFFSSVNPIQLVADYFIAPKA